MVCSCIRMYTYTHTTKRFYSLYINHHIILPGMKFHWVCLNVMETIPEYIVQDHQIPPYEDAVLEPKEYDPEVIEAGGCFGDGNYTFETKGRNYV